METLHWCFFARNCQQSLHTYARKLCETLCSLHETLLGHDFSYCDLLHLVTSICMDIESNPGPTTPSTHQFSSLFNTTKRIQLGYQHHRKNYDFYTANNIIPKSLLPRCIPAFDTNNCWFYKKWRNICRLTARRHLILLTKECRRKIKHLQKELTFYKNH